MKKVHFINPSYSWTKTLILGSCVKTSISVECFSSLETGLGLLDTRCKCFDCTRCLFIVFTSSIFFGPTDVIQ